MNSSCARAIVKERANMSITITAAAMIKAVNAAPTPPKVNAYPARPTRIGPVQPKPAKR